MAAPDNSAPWVIVAGGFHPLGGMDRANLALARHLIGAGTPVHLVAHEIDSAIAAHPLVTAHRVVRPTGMPALADHLLGRAGMKTARDVLRTRDDARVVVNGGNCPWPDINWVHALHAAWPVCDGGAPWWSRYRNRRLKEIARRRERQALGQARIVIANSEATRHALHEHHGIHGDRVRTVYLGSDPSWGPADPAERERARSGFDIPPGAPVVAFVGTLGADINKGFDVLWEAWKQLRASARWDAHLLVAGGGWRLPQWRKEAARDGGSSVRFLGFTPAIREVLAASDLLVSPVRYEAYGLNVHEALCRGMAVMVTRTAGVAERFDAAMAEALLPAQIAPGDLAVKLAAWRGDVDGWLARTAATAARIRARTWDHMAADFVRTVEQAPRRLSA